MQGDDVDAARERVTGAGIRLLMDAGGHESAGIQLHPKEPARRHRGAALEHGRQGAGRPVGPGGAGLAPGRAH